MLDIKDIKGLGGEELLKSYEGRNPYINYMKKKYFNFEPRSMNKVIELTNYFAEQLKEEYKLKVPIKKILIETLLAESDKALHVICKFYKKSSIFSCNIVPFDAASILFLSHASSICLVVRWTSSHSLLKSSLIGATIRAAYPRDESWR